MKTKLPKNWMPPENVLKLARSKGMPIENWLYHLLPEWRLYWIDSGLMKDSWGSTFWNWAKKQWRLVDKRRMYKEQTPINYEEDLRQPDPRKNVETYTTDHTVPMSLEKRLAFADYLSRRFNKWHT